MTVLAQLFEEINILYRSGESVADSLYNVIAFENFLERPC